MFILTAKTLFYMYIYATDMSHSQHASFARTCRLAELLMLHSRSLLKCSNLRPMWTGCTTHRRSASAAYRSWPLEELHHNLCAADPRPSHPVLNLARATMASLFPPGR